MNEKIGTLQVDDRDEIRNKVPVFSIPDKKTPWIFGVEVSKPNKDGDLVLKQVEASRSPKEYSLYILERCNGFVEGKRHTWLKSIFCSNK